MKRIVLFIVAMIVFSAGAGSVFAQQRLTFAVQFVGFNSEAAKIATRTYFSKYLELKYPGKYLVVSGDTAQHILVADKNVWEQSGQEPFYVQPGQKLDKALAATSVIGRTLGAVFGYGSRKGQIAGDIGYNADYARYELQQPVQQWMRVYQRVGISIKVDDFEPVSDIDTFQLYYYGDGDVPQAIVDDKAVNDSLLPPKSVGPGILMMLQSFRHRLDEFRF